MRRTEINLRLTWLRLGVPLQIPPTPLDRCETTLSVLARRDGEGFERRDSWRYFEAGHGYASGDEVTERSLSEVDADLAAWSVAAVVPHLPPPRGARLAEHLDALVRGEVVADGWFEETSSVWRTRAIGGDDGVLLIRACVGVHHPSVREGDIARVSRASADDLLALAPLSLPTGVVRSVTEGDRALLARARTFRAG